VDFITQDLKNVWNTEGFPAILNLNMLPYGNAQSSGGQVTCQHGTSECNLNMVEACGIKHLPEASDYMAFVFCVEGSDHSKSPDAIITSCAKDKETATGISTCYAEGSGAEGKALIADNAKQTQALGHKYTPWLVIDGEHSTSGEDNLKKAICAAYKGSAKPAACNSNDADHDIQKCPRFPNNTTLVV